jgi:hypothetical protein
MRWGERSGEEAAAVAVLSEPSAGEDAGGSEEAEFDGHAFVAAGLDEGARRVGGACEASVMAQVPWRPVAGICEAI